MAKKGLDSETIIKIMNSLEVLSTINRMKYDSYDDHFINNINNMSNIDKACSLLKYVSKNGDKKSRESARHLIKLLHDIDLIKDDVGYLRKNNKYDDKILSAEYKHNVISKEGLYNKETNVLNKIITFLNYLNDEE